MTRLPETPPLRWPTRRAAAILLTMLVGGSALASPASEPMTSGGPTTFRRLNEVQYTRSIEDIFGAAIKIPGRFDPPLREEGLLAIGKALAARGMQVTQDDIRAMRNEGRP